MANEYKVPDIQTGDPVYWYADPMNPRDPASGWLVGKPGAATNTLLVFVPTVGFIEKPSVRHIDDPGLIENPNWRQWGCWDFAPWFKRIKRIEQSMATVIAASEKETKRGTTK